MRFALRWVATVAAVVTVSACSSNGNGSVVPSGNAQQMSSQSASSSTLSPSFAAPSLSSYTLPANVHRACNDYRPGFAHCTLLVRDGMSPDNSAYNAKALEAAYNLPSTTAGSSSTIVAIVDAYDNPNVASDLAFYRKAQGLPVVPSFHKYNQEGKQKNYPKGDTGWGGEMDLDVQMVSASCPACSIIVVEATTASSADLGAAENEAVKLGATIVSNSYSGGGSSPADYDHKGVAILASAGDDGYGIGDPADFDSVVAVGGTSLTHTGSSGRGYTETAWNGTGSGCSNQPKPNWQHDSGCSNRTANDVSAVADPNTGVLYYDTYGGGGWGVVGGTSVSSPLLAGVFGLAGNANKQDGGKTFWEKKHEGPDDLNDVTSGSNGSCTPSYLCNAGPGYDGPTGWGTPNGIGAF